MVSPDAGIPETLIKRLREGKLVPFVGAGVSMNVMRRHTSDRLFPNWTELLQCAADRLKAEQKTAYASLVTGLLELGRPEDYLDAARRAAEGLGASWYDCLREQLDHSRDEADDSSLEIAP